MAKHLFVLITLYLAMSTPGTAAGAEHSDSDSLYPIIAIKISLQPLERGRYSLLTHDSYDSTVYITWNYKNLDSLFSKVPEAYKYYCKAERNLKVSRGSGSLAAAGFIGIIVLYIREKEDDALMAPSVVGAVGGALSAWIAAKIAKRQLEKAVDIYNTEALKNGRKIPDNVRTREEANEPAEEEEEDGDKTDE
jgi:hypothetical protein